MNEGGQGVTTGGDKVGDGLRGWCPFKDKAHQPLNKFFPMSMTMNGISHSNCHKQKTSLHGGEVCMGIGELG